MRINRIFIFRFSQLSAWFKRAKKILLNLKICLKILGKWYSLGMYNYGKQIGLTCARDEFRLVDNNILYNSTSV